MSRMIAAAAFAAAAFAFATPALAKAPPEGSYRETCRDLYVDGDTVYGSCQNDRGKWKKTWISGYQYCDGDIVNRNGVLDCDGGRKPEYTKPAPVQSKGDMPPGGWANACRDAGMDGRVLRATCRDDRGTWRPTWFDTRQCRDGLLEVEDGILICVAPPPPPPPPRVQPMKDMLPQGAWIDNCRSGVVANWKMKAECYAGDGEWLLTQLNLQSCKRNDVGAPGGRLRCN